MYLLTSQSIESVKEAVHYYDCATDREAYGTILGLKTDEGIGILTGEELRALRNYIHEMEDTVFNGGIAPVKPNVVNELLG